MTEESLTYLNQGQSYGIRITRRPEEFQKANIPLKWVKLGLRRGQLPTSAGRPRLAEPWLKKMFLVNLIFSTPLRVQLRVVFHDRRLQNTEDEQLKNWSKGRKEFETIIIR